MTPHCLSWWTPFFLTASCLRWCSSVIQEWIAKHNTSLTPDAVFKIFILQIEKRVTEFVLCHKRRWRWRRQRPSVPWCTCTLSLLLVWSLLLLLALVWLSLQIQAASLIFAQRKFSISFGAQWVIVRLCCQGRTSVMLRNWNYLRMFRFNWPFRPLKWDTMASWKARVTMFPLCVLCKCYYIMACFEAFC